MEIDFHHIALQVLDMERSISFYVNGLRFRVERDTGYAQNRVVVLQGWGMRIELFANGVDRPVRFAKWAHLAFYTETPDSAYENALAVGAKTYLPPCDYKPHQYATSSDRIAFVRGPDGELIEFILCNTII